MFVGTSPVNVPQSVSYSLLEEYSNLKININPTATIGGDSGARTIR